VVEVDPDSAARPAPGTPGALVRERRQPFDVDLHPFRRHPPRILARHGEPHQPGHVARATFRDLLADGLIDRATVQ